MSTPEDRLAALEEQVQLLTNLQEINTTDALRSMARIEALTSIIREICEHFAIDGQQFHHAVEERTKIFHDTALHAIENRPFAASLDNRTPEELEAPTDITRLLPYPSK